jgi:hypothetical protein
VRAREERVIASLDKHVKDGRFKRLDWLRGHVFPSCDPADRSRCIR